MKKISIAIMVLVVALASCKKTPEVNLKYVDVERDLITVGTTTATVQCDYDYIATLKKAYFYYGEGTNEADMNKAEMRVVQNTLYVDLTGLRANATYSYFYEFHNGFNSMRTALKTFKTEASPTSVILPTVVTATVTEITANSAKGGGEVTNDGGAQVTERGICWSTHANPTLSDNHVAAGEGTGAFTALMNGLEANTTYHVRAYATNEAGTAYGLDKEFVTIGGGGTGGVPEGAINGLFTINENGDQVYFSQGNLQYQASTNTWRFAENQWDMLAKPEDMTSHHEVYGDVADMSTQYTSSSTAWIDMFGWGTSGWHDENDPYNVYYQPWSTSNQGVVPYCGYNIWGYGPSVNMPSPSLIGSSANYDWGVYNAISNGGNAAGLWRTLTLDEWEYVFHTRTTDSGIHFAMACVNGVNGVIILPDNWSNDYYSLNNADLEGSFGHNVIGLTIWNNAFQVNGAVFLPATGERSGPWVYSIGSRGKYWQVVHDTGDGGHSTEKVVSFGFVNIGYLYVGGDFGWTYRCFGISVRLVQDAH